MRFREGLAGLGFICGVGLTLCVVLAVELLSGTQSILCDAGESGVSCVRNWFNGVAIMAGAATVWLLIREQTTTREVAILQTLEVRGKLVHARRLSDTLDIVTAGIAELARDWPLPDSEDRDHNVAMRAARFLVWAEEAITDPVFREICRFDIRVARRRTDLENYLADLLGAIIRQDWTEYVRKNRNNFGPIAVNREWYIYVNGHEFTELAQQVHDLGKSVTRLSEHLLEFRGSVFFQQRKETDAL